jgi:hypothetical protein
MTTKRAQDDAARSVTAPKTELGGCSHCAATTTTSHDGGRYRFAVTHAEDCSRPVREVPRHRKG